MAGATFGYALRVEKRTRRLPKFAMSVPNLGDALVTADLTK